MLHPEDVVRIAQSRCVREGVEARHGPEVEIVEVDTRIFLVAPASDTSIRGLPY